MYGIVILPNGKKLNPGFTLDDVEYLAHYADDNECDIGDVTGDLAIAPKLLLDLVTRIKQLEAKCLEKPLTRS